MENYSRLRQMGRYLLPLFVIYFDPVSIGIPEENLHNTIAAYIDFIGVPRQSE